MVNILRKIKIPVQVVYMYSPNKTENGAYPFTLYITRRICLNSNTFMGNI